MPRILHALAWLTVVVIIALALLGILGRELKDGMRLFRLTLEVEIENQYVSYPWYLRIAVIGAPAAAMGYAMAQLALMLGYAARGEVFSAPASGHLRRFGSWLLLATLAEIVLPLPTQFVNQLLQSPETFKIALDFDSEIVWKVFFSTLVMLLARVLSDGYRLAEENRQFI